MVVKLGEFGVSTSKAPEVAVDGYGLESDIFGWGITMCSIVLRVRELRLPPRLPKPPHPTPSQLPPTSLTAVAF